MSEFVSQAERHRRRKARAAKKAERQRFKRYLRETESLDKLIEDVDQLERARAEMLRLYSGSDLRLARTRISGTIQRVLVRIAEIKIEQAQREEMSAEEQRQRETEPDKPGGYIASVDLEALTRKVQKVQAGLQHAENH